MTPNEQADVFAKELKALVEKHYGSLTESQLEPFGMQLRKALPVAADAATGSVTTTATISLPLDTDPPDSDD
jgi:hypothetical protein